MNIHEFLEACATGALVPEAIQKHAAILQDSELVTIHSIPRAEVSGRTLKALYSLRSYTDADETLQEHLYTATDIEIAYEASDREIDNLLAILRNSGASYLRFIK